MGITVTDLVVRYFERMREAFAGDGVPKSVRDVAGIVPKEVDTRKSYRDHLLDRYA